VAALLVALGLVLLFADVLTGGFGLLGSVGLVLLALFFWGHTLVGLAGWEGVTLVVAGVGLLALELFVLPGLGVAGLLGAAALLGGLYLSLVGTGVVTSEDVTRAVSTLLGAAVLAALSGLALLRLLPRAAVAQGLVLRSRVGQAETRPPMSLPRGGRWRWIEGDRLEPQGTSNTYGVPDAEPASLQGAVGVAVTDLRPGGVALLRGERVDVVTGGDYIMSGDQIVVVADEGYRRVVRRAESGAANLSDSGKE